MQRLARRRAELADAFGVRRVAARTGHGPVPAQHVPHGRGAAAPAARCRSSCELAPAFGSDPIAGPRRRQHSESPQTRRSPRLRSASSHGAANHLGRRTADISRRQSHLKRAVRLRLDETNQAEIDDAQGRDLRIFDRCEGPPCLRSRRSAIAQAAGAEFTSVLPDKCAADTASRRGCSRDARCAGRACHARHAERSCGRLQRRLGQELHRCARSTRFVPRSIAARCRCSAICRSNSSSANSSTV